MSNYDWQADAKIHGQHVVITFENGEFTATGEMADVALSMFERELEANLAAATVNPIVTGQLSDLFAKSLRAIAPVYGIDDRMNEDEDMPADAVI